ncbi:MAG: hypothetical protein ACJ8AO_10120, partial [Gemmatimonadaceae bacterium]
MLREQHGGAYQLLPSGDRKDESHERTSERMGFSTGSPWLSSHQARSQPSIVSRENHPLMSMGRSAAGAQARRRLSIASRENHSLFVSVR